MGHWDRARIASCSPTRSASSRRTQPDDDRLRFPLYRARVAPDIHFVGFDLTARRGPGRSAPRRDGEARATIAGDKLGWFFVLQEVVGEPRFGLDVNAPAEPSASKWDNLSWVNIDLGGGQTHRRRQAVRRQPVPGADGGVDVGQPTPPTWPSILYQKPVMVAVHGRNMLKNLKPIS